MTQHLFASDNPASLANLDANFSQIYALRELISDPSYTAAVTRIAIDSSGRIGIGISTPACKLHVEGTSPEIRSSGLAGSTAILNLVSVGVFSWSLNGSSSLIFKRDATELARYDSAGNFMVGTTSTTPNPGFAVSPTGSVSTGNSAGGTGWLFHSFIRSGTTIGSIAQSGTTAVLYNTTSDARLKSNIVDAPDAGAVIDAIQVRSFDWQGAPDEHVTHGFVAQELAEHAPQAVKVGDSGDVVTDAWAVDPSKLVALLVKEVQSLRSRVAALEAL